MTYRLRKTIQSYLETKHPRVYFKRAPEIEVFPYIVFDLDPSFTPDEAREQLTITVDGWDSPTYGDSAALETLMELINGDGALDAPSGLDKQAIQANDLLAIFRLDSRSAPDDEDPAILRRTYTYDTTIFERRTS